MLEDLVAQGKVAYAKKDYKTAAVIYEKAMEAGNARAMNFLAGMYLSGLGVKKDQEKAYELFKKAAEAGDQLAISTANILGLIHVPSPYEQFRTRIEEVHVIRKEGKYQEALHKYVEFARNNELSYEYQAECMYWIGMMYKAGQGVPQNVKRAKEWLRKAADKNYDDAIAALELDNEVICKNDQAKVTICIRKYNETIHAAEILAQLAQLFKSDIEFHEKGKTVDAKSILAVANLELHSDTVVDITAKGEDAEEAVTRIVNLISSKFNLKDEYIANLISTGKIKIVKKTYKTVDSAADSPEIECGDGYAKAITCIKHIYGIHYRPAHIWVQLANLFTADIKFRAKGKAYWVDAKNILMVMGSALLKGTKVEIYAEGKDAEEAVKRLANLIYSGFDIEEEYIADLISSGKLKLGIPDDSILATKCVPTKSRDSLAPYPALLNLLHKN
ncbi:HPr family phosphocarrier protein [Selenomonas sp. KH1T6]|uniref:HPr family phosphocarrier protein n=1 Tax=Selenomonas sp. KH1T6 TaxID=3158784 RepID=UPI0008A7E868|nr:phosphotransferase system HPr (HPr) family [Selenomonas ruminantium]